MTKLFSWDTAAVFVRLVLGAVFIYHGGQKVLGWSGGVGWDKAVHYFTAMGVPHYLAMAVPITEFAGGCCLVIGLLTRFWSAGLAIVMANAIVLVTFKAGWPQGKFNFDALWKGNELQLSLLAMALALFLGGPGRWAIADLEGWVLGLKRGKSKAAPDD
jgi:putative oxidoreductase